MKTILKKALIKVPAVQRYLAEKNRLSAALTVAEARLAEFGVARNGWWSETPALLIEQISSGNDLNSGDVRTLAVVAEHALQQTGRDPVAMHRDIGRAIFDRDPALYLAPPPHLKRFTYPAYLSVHLNEHCNAACFFCRDNDFKGRLLDFEQLHKLDSGFRMARVIELTGWGEPFFYPKLDQVVDKVLALNSSPHLLSFTTNGSMLSTAWGKKLSGKIHRLCISINAASAPTYETQMRYKNARFTFGYVVDHIREFMAEITPADVARIAFHMVANTDNFREIPDLVRLAAEMKIPTVTIGNYVCADERYIDKSLIGVKQEYNDVISRSSEIALENGVELSARKFFTNETTVNAQDSCLAPFERLYAEVPGDVAPCCFMGWHRMGNVYEAGVEGVWFSQQMQALRKSRHLPACTTCTLYNPFDDDISHLSSYLIELGAKKLTEIKGTKRIMTDMQATMAKSAGE
ncbi:radical SAM protein [Bradyrhizobium lablabi]|uniref:Radical SAM superfamily enzyme, MoaA/NifB/PqqE/SkfB family n=1 Tax=Bradyrhizobium lablabi TaxID=722472 RepID=A0A1H5JHE6_9BRAD|nr:radical SAM protein [Bradyrhizobium lablabi]SEE51854.1 Radical SAM superfamily enzyme, MoaA/NifB/PqqE/SkfB family [Bradyrhizobium lablabi]